MNIMLVFLVLLFVLTLGAALVDLVWHNAPRRGKWPHPPQTFKTSRLRRLENVRRVETARLQRDSGAKIGRFTRPR